MTSLPLWIMTSRSITEALNFVFERIKENPRVSILFFRFSSPIIVIDTAVALESICIFAWAFSRLFISVFMRVDRKREREDGKKG